MVAQKKLYDDLSIKKEGIQVECQTECDSETLERLCEDVRSHELLIHTQNELFETELRDIQMKEKLSREEVIYISMKIDESNSNYVRFAIGTRV